MVVFRVRTWRIILVWHFILRNASAVAVVFSASSIADTFVTGTISLNDSFPLVRIDGRGQIRERDPSVSDLTAREPEISFLWEQRFQLTAFRRLLGQSAAVHNVTYECDFAPRLLGCLVVHIADGVSVRSSTVTALENKKKVVIADQPSDNLTQFTTELDLSLLRNNDVSIHGRWSSVRLKIMRLAAPEHLEVSFHVSVGKHGFFCCSVWSPAPLLFDVTVKGGGLRSISLNASRRLSDTVALLNDFTTSPLEPSDVVCVIRSSLGWTVTVTTPSHDQTKFLRKATTEREPAACGMGLSLVTVVAIVSTFTVLKGVLCAYVFLRRDDAERAARRDGARYRAASLDELTPTRHRQISARYVFGRPLGESSTDV
ncbi:m150 protein [Murid betaherpesvirus 1]|nr:m150 protein [Murid betaherpesvirus 1]